MPRRGIIFALLLAVVFLLAAGYFFLTGSFFLTRVLTPLIGDSADCPLTIGHAVFRPFSGQLILHDFRLGRPDAPFLAVRRARGYASLWDLCRGVIAFDEVELSGAELNITPEAMAVFGAGGAASGEPAEIPLRIGRVQAENSRINVEIRDDMRFSRWSFDGVSASAAGLRSGGTMELLCHSSFRAKGRHGMDFAGELEWNGELSLDRALRLAGIRGAASFGRFTGRIDRHELADTGVRLSVDARRDGRHFWKLRRLQLIRPGAHATAAVVDLSGGFQLAPYRYELEIRRSFLAGNLLTVLTDMGCGVRPGDMRVDGRGRICGDEDRFEANVECRIERAGGPAFFGEDEFDLPDFRLTANQDFLFDWRTQHVELRRVDADVFSGGRRVASVRKSGTADRTAVELNGIGLDLLLLLNPEVRGLGLRGGTASGSIVLQPGAGADTLASETKIVFSGVSVRSRSGKSRPFDGELAAQCFLPLAGRTVKVERLSAEIRNDGAGCLRLDASGSVPLRRGPAEFRWRIAAEPERLLALLPSGTVPGAADLRSFAPLALKGGGVLRFDPDGVTLKDHSLTLTGRDSSRVRLALPEYRFRFGRSGSAETWTGTWDAEFPAAFLPASAAGVTFSGGICRVNGTWSVYDRAGWDLTLAGEALGQRLAGQWRGQTLPVMSGGLEFGVRRSADGVWNLNRGTLVCRTGGHPILRLECVGSCGSESGEFRGETHVRYADERFMDLFLPGVLRSGQFSGGCRFSGNFLRGQWSGSGSLRLEKLLSTGAARAVGGELRCDLRRTETGDELDGRLMLARDDDRLADLRLEMHAPVRKDAPIDIRLASEKLDLRSCYEQLAGSTERREPSLEVRRTLDFGVRPKRVRLSLKNMRWGDAHDFSLEGDLRLHRSRLRSRHLVLGIGGGRIDGALDGMDFPTGMMLAASGRVSKPVDLRAVTALFYPDSGFSGTLSDGKWNLLFRRLFAADWGGELVGDCRLRFAGMELPVDAANGPLSRLLLLPVETVVRAEKLIPSSLNIREHFRTLWRHQLSKDSPFALLRFSEGELRMNASDGVLRVESLRFAGEPLERMLTRGTMDLRDPYELKLDSEVALCGVEALIPIGGPLAAPRVATWKVLAQLPGQTLNSWVDVFAHPDADRPLAGMPVVSPFVRLLRDLTGFRSR